MLRPPKIARLARIINERCAFVHNAPAASGVPSLPPVSTPRIRAVLKTSPGLVLSEGHRIGLSRSPQGGLFGPS
jgi:hypothetical protein